MTNINSVDVAFQNGMALWAICNALIARPDLEVRLWNGQVQVWRRGAGVDTERMLTLGTASLEWQTADWQGALQALGGMDRAPGETG